MNIVINGATSFMGRRLAAVLLERHHTVTSVVRPGSESRAPARTSVVAGDPLRPSTLNGLLRSTDTLVHLVGVAHPSPAKAKEFRTIDLRSIEVAIAAARAANVRHVVYLSVASPAPVMKAYVQARLEGEALIRASGLSATFVKPWYVIGPGRRWPLLLLPMYWILEGLPSTRESTRRLGLVSLEQIVNAMVGSIENPPLGIRILDVPAIRQ